MDRRRTSAHSGANAGAGRSQPLIQAFQASCSASLSNPGSSDQCTGTQRLLPWASGGGSGPVSPGTGAVGAGVPAEGRWGAGGGGVEQAASIPTISVVRTTRRGREIMGWIVLEALLALALLLGIVWWTMFAGRRRGEPPRTPEDGSDAP